MSHLNLHTIKFESMNTFIRYNDHSVISSHRESDHSLADIWQAYKFPHDQDYFVKDANLANTNWKLAAIREIRG